MALSKEKIEYFKKKLEEKKVELEKELSVVGKENPNVPGDWVATPGDLNIMKSDQTEMADKFEEFENRSAIQDKLEEHLMMVNKALERTEKGDYGKCKCGDDIDEKRLEVFPSASTCMKHSREGCKD